jgi:hypothetical protein
MFLKTFNIEGIANSIGKPMEHEKNNGNIKTL